MKVSAIHAMPKSAIAATMPDDNSGCFMMSAGGTLRTRMMTRAAVNMSISMTGDMPIGTSSPSAFGKAGRRPEKRPISTTAAIATTKIQAEIAPPGGTSWRIFCASDVTAAEAFFA